MLSEQTYLETAQKPTPKFISLLKLRSLINSLECRQLKKKNIRKNNTIPEEPLCVPQQAHFETEENLLNLTYPATKRSEKNLWEEKIPPTKNNGIDVDGWH